MKIAIYDTNTIQKYNPDILFSQGIGGSETAIIQTALALQRRGHIVEVFINCLSPGRYNNVLYDHYRNFILSNTRYDLFIGCESFPDKINASKVINWVHRPGIRNILKFPFVDSIVLVSHWQKMHFQSLPSALRNRVVIIENGVEDCYYTENTKSYHKIIYAGFPGKGGMSVLPALLNRLGYPFQIDVYGSASLWGKEDVKFKTLYSHLKNAGINYFGQVGSNQLSKALSRAAIFIYPVGRIHLETFGLVVAQAMAAKCAVVSSAEGNLGNLLSDHRGIVIKGDIFSPEWVDEASNHIKDLTSNEKYRNSFINSAYTYIRNFTWERTAKKYENLIN